MRDNYRVNKYNTLAKVKPHVSHNSLGECIFIKENNKMSNEVKQYDEILVISVLTEVHIKVTENELELFEDHWDYEKRSAFIEKITDYLRFKPNNRIDSVDIINGEFEVS
tara:strand:- start:968 stop:1297 length:330 start_codon:yes stop_codon:yes gene_type:complete